MDEWIEGEYGFIRAGKARQTLVRANMTDLEWGRTCSGLLPYKYYTKLYKAKTPAKIILVFSKNLILGV